MSSLAKPAYMIIAGAVLYVLSFQFGIVFIGIPPQDPPPEMIRERIALYTMQAIMEWTAFIVFVAGVLYLAVVMMRRAAKS
jgi:hypothetical protein